MERPNAWQKYNEEDKRKVFDFAEDYRKFISDCKTERECVKRAVELAKENGYEDLNEVIKNNKKFKNRKSDFTMKSLFLVGTNLSI